MSEAEYLSFTHETEKLKDCNYYIVAVPTPIDESKRPDLEPLKRASETVAECLNQGDIVIYESTVYPGATEEVCVPILEAVSGLAANGEESNGAVEDKVRAEVTGLCGRFPIYPGL